MAIYIYFNAWKPPFDNDLWPRMNGFAIKCGIKFLPIYINEEKKFFLLFFFLSFHYRV